MEFGFPIIGFGGAFPEMITPGTAPENTLGVVTLRRE
jgi:hypothetical protein